jgi:hypothetical protein
MIYEFAKKHFIIDQNDDFKLSDLYDKELVEQIEDDLYDGLDDVFARTATLLARN